MADYQINLGFFEGPLDLLLHLVKKNKFEVNDISLSKVTEQYLDYIRKMQELDLDFAGDFLLTAAQLMQLKSRTLLPSHNAEEDLEENSPHELVTKLLEYKQFKELAGELKEREEVGSLFYSRENEELIEEITSDLPDLNPLENVTLDDFRQAFVKALKDAEERAKLLDEEEEEDGRPQFKVEEITLKDKMLEVEAIVENLPEGIGFSKLFSKTTHRIEVVVTFLALLELMKLKKIKVTQGDLYGEITLCQEG